MNNINTVPCTRQCILARLPTELRLHLLASLTATTGVCNNPASNDDILKDVDEQTLALLRAFPEIRDKIRTILYNRRMLSFTSIEHLQAFVAAVDRSSLSDVRSLRLCAGFAIASLPAFESVFCNILRNDLTCIDRMLIDGLSLGYVKRDGENSQVLDCKLIAIRDASCRLAHGKVFQGKLYYEDGTETEACSLLLAPQDTSGGILPLKRTSAWISQGIHLNPLNANTGSDNLAPYWLFQELAIVDGAIFESWK